MQVTFCDRCKFNFTTAMEFRKLLYVSYDPAWYTVKPRRVELCQECFNEFLQSFSKRASMKDEPVINP